MFRVPKSSKVESNAFYQEKYSEGFTTDCPDEALLGDLIKSSFKGTEKDYSTYLSVLHAVGLRTGQIIFDFGSSWGYGSWQFAQAGFRVYSHEISGPRARYASEKLGCWMVGDAEHIPERADCFFSAHVLEHLPNPGALWETARRTLKPEGLMILFVPNGEPAREQKDSAYHKLWGQTHPLLLSADSLRIMGGQHGFEGHAYSSPYDLLQIERSRSGSLEGEELLFVARRSTID